LTLIISVLLVSMFCIASESFAQRGMGRRGYGGWSPGNQYCGVYKPETVETFSGEVISIEKTTPRKETFYGIHLTMKTVEETVHVHLGPGWYIENQDIKIEPKDKLEVTGSRITFEGNEAIIAEEVKKGEEVLKLRDERGIPYWSGWRKQTGQRPFGKKGLLWMGCCGCGPSNQLCSMYTPLTIETVYGEVVSTEIITQRKGSFYGVHLTVKTDHETIAIHLGPGRYIENQNFTINQGDKVEIKGHRISDNGKEVIIAAEVKKGHEILRLRDENGLPFWRGKMGR
jgi:hypothetical protein